MKARILKQVTKTVPIDSVSEHPKNPNRNDVERISESIEHNGFYGTILVQKSTGFILAGNHRHRAAKEAGLTEIPVTFLDVPDDQAAKIMIADNRTAEFGRRDEATLAELLKELDGEFGIEGTGYSDEDLSALLQSLSDQPELRLEEESVPAPSSLSDQFGVPPFSVLNAREGWWQGRKQDWIRLGIKSEIGRPADLMGGMKNIAEREKYIYGKTPSEIELYLSEKANGNIPEPEGMATGTSIFDPVLAELLVRWFCPKSGSILDPFAGGSVRGVVSGMLGRNYLGLELRQEQVAANEDQVSAIGVTGVEYITGDSDEILETLTESEFDMILTCPPYGDLEVYSDDSRDLSNMPYDEFLRCYESIMRKSVSHLKQNRFMAVVVGEIRNKKGNYRNLVGETIRILLDCGLNYYNEAILVTAVASASTRARRQFTSGRKLVKTHQNVLVFVKGSGMEATKEIGEVEFNDIFTEIESIEETPLAA